jgi:hypothetical protein
VCGIAGIWHRDGRAVAHRVLESMRDTLVHPGPPDVGAHMAGYAGSRGPQEIARPDDLRGSIQSDHTACLALAMGQDVRCWRTSGGCSIFCDRCRLIGEAAPS